MESLNSQKGAVQETCNEALCQKLYAIEKGYFADSYQKLFYSGNTLTKYLPLINRGTWSRVRAVREQIETLFKLNSVLSENSTQIINLGCGLDSLYFYLKAKFQTSRVRVIDLDYTEITKQKIKLISKSQELQSILKENNSDDLGISSDKKKLNTKEYSIYNVDISNVSDIKGVLKNLEVSGENLTIIVAECLLCYVGQEEVEQLQKTLAQYFNNVAFVYYDLLNPFDEFGKVMIQNLRNYRNIVLPSYELCPYTDSHIERLKSNGFNSSGQCIDMLTYYNTVIPREEQIFANSLELLDELEEWNMLQKHYCIGVSIKHDQLGTFSFLVDYSIK